MHRTQVYLDEDLDQALGELARQRGISKASLIREAARRLLAEEQESWENDPILGIVGMGSSGQSNMNVARDHDRVLADLEIARWRQK